MLSTQLPWFVGGPVLGLCVVAMRWLLNERLGAMGGWSDVVRTLGAGRLSLGPFGWMLVGLIVGGAGFALAGGPGFAGYGWLTDALATPAVVAVLFVAGLLTGLGTKLAGGCTSGNGLSGNAMSSPAALLATATFFATAIVVTVVTEALT